jgi:regulator of protease activity HflC (stomatin/prohibitin superfamily)
MKKLLFLLVTILVITSCTTVESGHRGVKVTWGGKTDMERVYPEGMNGGMHWVWDDMIEYDVREKTLVKKFDFNDKNNMPCPVEFSIDYKLDATKVNIIHSTIGKDQLEAKILTTLSSAAKQVVPMFGASELNLSKRQEAETLVLAILQKEFPDFYVTCSRVRITDVDIPTDVANAAKANAKQAEMNKLALSKVIEAENNFKAAEWDSKTKDILSKPAMLELKRLDIQMEYAKKGASPWGNNNVFGVPQGLLLNK